MIVVVMLVIMLIVCGGSDSSFIVNQGNIDVFFISVSKKVLVVGVDGVIYVQVQSVFLQCSLLNLGVLVVMLVLIGGIFGIIIVQLLVDRLSWVIVLIGVW